jgi:Zn-finger nucleic acid-binding protein
VEPSAQVSRRWSRDVVYRKCPECAGTMQRKNFAKRSGVIVDWCGKHGTWLDADELEEIAAYVLAGGLDKAAGAEGFHLAPDPDKLRARYEAEKLLAEEKTRSDRRHGALTGDTSHTLRTLGDFLSNLLDG